MEGRGSNLTHLDLTLDGLRLIAFCGFERGFHGGIPQQFLRVLRETDQRGEGGQQEEPIILH